MTKGKFHEILVKPYLPSTKKQFLEHVDPRTIDKTLTEAKTEIMETGKYDTLFSKKYVLIEKEIFDKWFGKT